MNNHPLWEYSLAVYSKPSVDTLLVQLQDDYGADVNMLLLAFFQAKNNLRLNTDDYQFLLKQVAGWQSNAVVPLRSVRRYLKNNDSVDVQKIREKIKTVEVEAEAWQQSLLFEAIKNQSYEAGENDFSADALHNIKCYSALWPGVDWEDISAIVVDLLACITHHAE